VANKDIAKQWFETGDKPTQAQFWQIFDWLRWADTAIAMDQITGLNTALNSKVSKADYEGNCIGFNGDSIYEIPGGYLLESIIPYYGSNGSMKLSVVANGDSEVVEVPEVNNGWNNPVVINWFAENNTIMYIAGIPNGSKLVFLTRKIKMNP
jgi:hypothetical protein